MIYFQEEKTVGYRTRTIKNADADATLAFAMDFNTAGERLTKQAVRDNKKMYIALHIKKLSSELEQTIRSLNKIGKSEIILNIAGNGIYTLKKYHITQNYIDEIVYLFLKEIIESSDSKFSIIGIRTGGQTGVDEAGAKAGDKFQIPTLVLAPKGWVFRNEYGLDISNESLFKRRFG